MHAAVSIWNTSVMTEQISVLLQPLCANTKKKNNPLYLITVNDSASHLCINMIFFFLKNLASSYHKPMKVNF